jgi:hypothetical protein
MTTDSPGLNHFNWTTESKPAGFWCKRLTPEACSHGRVSSSLHRSCGVTQTGGALRRASRTPRTSRHCKRSKAISNALKNCEQNYDLSPINLPLLFISVHFPHKHLLKPAIAYHKALSHQIDQGFEHAVGHGDDSGRGFVSALIN